jgi:hypothetical protein
MDARRLASLAAVLTAVLAAVVASAADHVVGGTQLTLRAGAGGALTLQLRDPSLPIPAPGSPDDPSSASLLLTLFGRGSRTQGSVVAVPGAKWRVRTSPIVTYRYADPAVAPGSVLVSNATLRAGAGLRVRAKTAALALTSPEGAIAVRVQMGTTRVCALFDPPAVRRDAGGRVVARDADAAALPNCDDDTLLGLPCEESGAACGGSCPGDAECAGGAGVGGATVGCECVSPHQSCGGTWPACNGECPAGEECADTGGTPYSSCGCLPVGSTPCGGVYPSCGDGDCPAGTTCLLDTFTCCGGTQISNCACLTGPPPPPCGGTCPAGWNCVGPAPGFPETCLPPFCSGGSGAPACDGTCSQPGTECRALGGVCFCLAPCIGGDPFPTCGGTCADPTWTCTPAVDGCSCLPPS